MRNKAKRLIVWLLTFTMIFSCFPLTVFAAGDDSAVGGHIRLSDALDSDTPFYTAKGNAMRFSLSFYQGATALDAESDKDKMGYTLEKFNELMAKDPDTFQYIPLGSIDVIYTTPGVTKNLSTMSASYKTVVDYMSNIRGDNANQAKLNWKSIMDGMTPAYYDSALPTITFAEGSFFDVFPNIFNASGKKAADKDALSVFFMNTADSDLVNKDPVKYFENAENLAKLNHVVAIANACIQNTNKNTNIRVTAEGLIYGYFEKLSPSGTWEKSPRGILQLYYEPIQFLKFDGKRFAVTFREAFAAAEYYKDRTISFSKTYKPITLDTYHVKSYSTLYHSLYNGATMGKRSVQVTNDDTGKSEYITASGGTVKNYKKNYNSHSYLISVEFDVVGATYTPPVEEGATTFAGMFHNSYMNFANMVYLARNSGEAILGMTKMNGSFKVFSNEEINRNSDYFKSGGLGIFTSFNAFGNVPNDVIAKVKLVKSYVIKDGTGFKEYKPSESTVITDSDVHTILRNGVVEKTNLVEIQNAVDFMNGDVSCAGALNDIITTAEYYDNLSNVKWEGDEPIVNGKSLSSDLISGRVSNLITGTKNITKKDVLKASNDENVTVKSNIADDAKVASLIDSSINAGKSLSGKTVTFMDESVTTGEQKYNLFDNARDAGSSAVVSANNANTSSKMLLTAGIMADLKDKDGKEVKKLSAVYMEANPKGTAGEIAEKKALSQALWNQYKAEFYNGKNGPLPENTIFLRYVVVPTVNQYNVIEIKDRTTGKVTYVDGGTFKISIADDGSYKIHEPNADISMIEAVEWAGSKEVNNPEGDFSKKGVMPGDAPKQGVKEYTAGDNLVITNYPDSENLYVKWYVYKDSLVTGDTFVPQWRWSKYSDSVAGIVGDKAVSEMKFELTADTTTHKPTYLSPSGTYNYDIINPNGSLNTGSNTEMTRIYTNLLKEYENIAENNFFRSKGYTGDNSSKSNLTTETVTHGDTHAMYGIDGTLNMVKSTKATDGSDNNMLITANWLNNNDLTAYYILTGNKPLGYSGGKQYYRIANLKYSLYNKNDYTHQIAYYYHTGKLIDICKCYTNKEVIGKKDASYETANYDINVVFNRYIAGDTKNKYMLTKPIVDAQNCKTTVKYQLTDTLNIYPEVGMLFENDKGDESIKWAVGEQKRTINPIVWQTLEHKVYVNETVVGTSVATDSRATAKARSIGFGALQTIYKGSATNTAFQIYRNSNMNQKGILTAKTFALDIDSAVKNAWGNNAYNSEKQHTALVNGIKNNNVKATEKLLIDSQNFGDLDYTGDAKEQNTIKYQPIKYNNGEVTTFTHKLIVRGGYLVGVKYQDRNTLAYSNVKISDLKAKDEALYEAIVNMGLYNEANDKANTLFVAFENKTGDKLTEKTYADELAKARKALDGIDTTGEAKIVENAGWYSEDSTVLVIKEYVTNFEVPSTSFTDKISLTVKNLDTPINKNDFFTKVGKGYTFLRYDLTIPQDAVYNSVEKIGAYFEANGFDGTNNVNTPKYLVPNVTITDTTR